MTDSTQQTRCPHCQTRFRVTEAHLAVANGRVRCGQCRSVFDATQHWETPVPAPEEPVAEKTPADETTDSPTPSQPDPSPDSTETTNDEFDISFDDDELVFADDPDEDSTETYYQGSAEAQEELSDDFLSLEKEESALSGERRRPEQPEERSTFDESWAETLLEDDDGSDDRPLKAEEDTDLDLEEEFDLAPEFDSPEPEPAAPEPAADKPPTRPPENDLEDMSVEATIAQGSRHDPDRAWEEVKALPITASPSEPVSRWLWLWRSLALVLLAVVVAQIGWLHGDRLARIEPLRPLYAQACEWFGCELAPLVDTSRIRSRQLVIRSHPEQPGALLVEATLENRASFDQPFPALHLSFRNLDQQVVAQRVFSPSEYLPSGEAPDRPLNAGHSVRVRLAILDPGPDAINYRMDLMRLPHPGPG